MSNIEINRKNIADMLLGLYEKEPFSMNTNVEELECNVWGGYYEMDMTTAQISFNDNNSLTAYGNFITEFISGWTELLSRKDSISEELFQEEFAAWKTEIFEKLSSSIPWNGFEIQRMRRLSKISANIYHFSKCLSFSHPYENSTRLSLQMYHS